MRSVHSICPHSRDISLHKESDDTERKYPFALKKEDIMKEKASLSFSSRLFLFTFVLCIFCTICFCFEALSIEFQYGLPLMWQTLWQNIADASQKGILYLDGGGLVHLSFGYILISVLCMISFVLALVAYLRTKEAGKKAVILPVTMFGVIVLLLVGLIFFQRSSCVDLAPEGSGSYIQCALPLRPGVTVPMPLH